MGGRDEGCELFADGVRHRGLHQVAEALVAEEDRPVKADRHGGFVHGFYDEPVRPLGAGEGENLVAVGTGHDQGIHIAAADGTQGLFGLVEPGAELLDLLKQRLLGARFLIRLDAHGLFAPQVQADQDPLLVGHIADDLAQRQRQFFD